MDINSDISNKLDIIKYTVIYRYIERNKHFKINKI